ncbi:MAG: Ribosome-binding factor [Myxococcaceae bacterium]|nr:Ribosome-binding factor [Myxococcaceae bacterium]
MATKKKTDGKRSQKVAEQLRGELMKMFLEGEVHDPGAKTATVSAVVLTDDLRLAKVYVRMLDLDASEKARAAMLKALERAKGFLRRELSQRLDLRYAPDLRFYYDETVDRGRDMEALLRTIPKPSDDDAK